MKKLSLKAKLTILHTVLMTAVICGVLAVLFSLNSQELLSSVQSQLEKKVAESRNDIQYINGTLKFDSDLLELEHGIFLSVYASDGTLLYGKIPYEFENTVPFEDGVIRKYQGNDGTMFYVLDLIYQVPDYGVVDIRGITSITEAEESFRITLHLAFIFLPLLVLLTAVSGYSISRRALKPVAQMTQTVQAIQKDGDLSRRINLGDGKDEIYSLAATFDQLLEKVEEGLKREQQFTSDVAHELRTPIATMRLQCEALLEKKELDPEVRRGVQLLGDKINYLAQMVSQLLLLSRADQGRAKLDLEQVNFSELTELAVEEMRDTAIQRGIQICTEIRENVFICGDETLLIRFWMNLLKNAIEYGRENGTIRVGLRVRGNEIQGEIEDDGIGIRKQDLPHIWERFYQADKSRTDTGNSGLGLSMVKWIVEAHGGSISVQSEEGAGTLFYFTFSTAVKKN